MRKTLKGTATPHEEGFVYIFGLMMKYFEMVGWEKRWRQSQKDLYKTIYQTIKNIKPNAEVERHIASNTTTVLRFVWCFHFFFASKSCGKLFDFAGWFHIFKWQKYHRITSLGK
jgi:hypothetical protein